METDLQTTLGDTSPSAVRDHIECPASGLVASHGDLAISATVEPVASIGGRRGQVRHVWIRRTGVIASKVYDHKRRAQVQLVRHLQKGGSAAVMRIDAHSASGAVNRHDHVDNLGKISLRRAGRMHHLGIGATHRNTPVLILIDTTTVTVIHHTTGEILSEHDIDPTKTY